VTVPAGRQAWPRSRSRSETQAPPVVERAAGALTRYAGSHVVTEMETVVPSSRVVSIFVVVHF
jgi:hypothetical protein